MHIIYDEPQMEICYLAGTIVVTSVPGLNTGETATDEGTINWDEW